MLDKAILAATVNTTVIKRLLLIVISISGTVSKAAAVKVATLGAALAQTIPVDEKLHVGQAENEQEDGRLDAKSHHYVELERVAEFLAIVEEGVDLVAVLAEDGVHDHGVE